MTQHNFKVGDKVYMTYDPTISAIVTDVCDEGKYDYYVKEDGSGYTAGCHEYELLDAKTAFLTRLQSLLKEHNATIQAYMSGVDTMGLCIYFADENVAEADYKQNDTICEITADSIMDFDKM